MPFEASKKKDRVIASKSIETILDAELQLSFGNRKIVHQQRKHSQDSRGLMLHRKLIDGALNSLLDVETLDGIERDRSPILSNCQHLEQVQETGCSLDFASKPGNLVSNKADFIF